MGEEKKTQIQPTRKERKECSPTWLQWREEEGEERTTANQNSVLREAMEEREKTRKLKTAPPTKSACRGECDRPRQQKLK